MLIFFFLVAFILTISLTNPKRGHRLGTSSATWNKIKLAATLETWAENGGEGVASEANGGLEGVNGVAEPSSADSGRSTLVRQGPNGQICIWYPAHSIYEFWDWAGASEFLEGQETTKDGGDAPGITFVPSSTPKAEYTGDVLQLKAVFVVPGRKLWDMAFMRCTDGVEMFLSVVSDDDNGVKLEVRHEDNLSVVELPAYLEGDLRLQVSSRFVTVLSSKGYLYLLKYDRHSKCPIVRANNGGELNHIVNHSSRPIAEKNNIRLEQGELLLKTATFDSSPIFDIVGSWLVYSPTKVESDYYKQLVGSSDQVASSLQSLKLRKSLYTTVKLPTPGPLLYRVVSSVSNTALDKLYKFSEMSSKRVRGYLAKSDKIIDKDVSLHSISNSIGSALYSTASKLKKLAMSSGENEVVKVVDLANGQVMAMFKPPGGISRVSLSPYDLQLVHANYRGDNFYMWDLYKTPREVSLIGKFMRGKTSASIKEIFWFVNDKNTDIIKGTNSGFGCITKKLGSVHWYNINYVSCGNENNNHPNQLLGNRIDNSNSGQFLDSWILPSMKAVGFCKLPTCSNVPSSPQTSQTRVDKQQFYKVNQLAFLDQRNNLRLVSPLNGKHTFKYILPREPASSLPIIGESEAPLFNPIKYSRNVERLNIQEFDTPLCQAEIETCSPYLSLINNKNVEFSTYEISGDDPVNSFYDIFEDFGIDVPVNVFEFRGSGLSSPLMSSDEDLLRKFNNGIDISPENFSSNTVTE